MAGTAAPPRVLVELRNNQYRCLQQFFKWLADEEEIGDPMRKVKAPKVVAKPVPVFEDGEIDRILKMPRSRSDRGAAKRGDACRLRDAAISAPSTRTRTCRTCGCPRRGRR
ncbi:hypothetical protein [Nocardiopsis metallicus]|uniref:Integrase n=1 Tax=Nocardiopsis metallicus TaxID=179819 RepID=A0A840WJW0_9ACTN|nr:hypothetical protein [Nocardiopsis metallicus]MBB5493271.1 integrase [Nocardiopsis metallicus]